MPFDVPQAAKDAAAEIKAEAAFDASVIAEDTEAALDEVDEAVARQDVRIEASLDAVETRAYETTEAIDGAGREARRRVASAIDALRGR